MTMRIDVECQRCGKRVGTAKVSVALQGSFNAFDSSQISNERSLIVDEDDLKYWEDRHTMPDCEAFINARRKALVAT
jgi:hypothetical protein